MRRLQDVVLILLVVILGGWAVSALTANILGGRPFLWELTQMGMDVFVILVAVLLGVAAWTLASSPRSILALVVLALLIVNFPRFLIAFRGFGTIALLMGAVAVTWCNAVGAREKHVRHVPTTVVGGVVSFIAVSMYFLGCVFSLGQGLASNTESVHEASPDGTFVLRAAENDEAFGDVTQTVTVGREVGGLVSLQRNIYLGNGDRPSVRWIDVRTLQVNGARFDIYKDPPIDGYQY